ncbi:MAG: DNA repair protein RadA, partial [Patescibacteria group bacterium]
SGEESEEQIKMRASRISSLTKNDNFYLISLNNTDKAFSTIDELRPELVIIDSIQTMESENLSGLSGSVGQVRYAALSFIKIAKTLGIPVILVGHVTKEGMVAGPMVLSHMVDTVLFFEGEKFTQTRILRSLKNRFGPVDEVGIFAMQESGLSEIKDTEHLFMSSDNLKTPGSVLTVAMEGSRPFLVEIQALTVFSKFPMPRRVASGIDAKRLELLIAVLQKQGRLAIESMDIFVNIAGGFKLSDPASDLAVCLAIFSSYKNIVLSKTVAISEVGLLGELRSSAFYEKRVKEAQKLGFKKIFSNKTHKTLVDIISTLGGQNTAS